MSIQLETKLREYPSNYLSYSDLCALTPASADARSGQIKRAVKAGLLTRLKRESYCLGGYLQKYKPHPFALSTHLCQPSYVSLSSALSYHQLIPEAIYTTTCVTTQRAITLHNLYGVFEFRTFPKKYFFLGVSREVENKDVFFVATPWKAITDYVYTYKKNWTGIEPLSESLRIDLDMLPKLDSKFATQLATYYHHRRINRFIQGIMKHYHVD